jgi:DNA-directed RNA polymerase subunit RPC12/RpoP
MKLDVTIAGNRVTMAGRLDDTASVADLPARLPAGDIVIDTEGVTFVNSIGMREWIRLVRAVRGRLHLERVSDVLMTQMNLIAELAGAVAISSFHAQYVCPSCGAEAQPLVDASGRPAAMPALPCPECGSPMELGDFPERYLTIFKG